MYRDINYLMERVSGAVIRPENERYDAARAGWNLIVDQRPDLIILAANEEDVVTAVSFANTINAPVTVQATGHGQPKACAGGILINTSNLKSVEIDNTSKTATAGAGTIWKDVIEAAYPHGLAPVSGSSPDVSVVGFTVGGGYGITSRMHGLSIDNVRSFRIVLPSGEITVATPDENSDLFFAVMGGGGSFGVVTEITIDLHDHSEVFGGSVMFDASLAPEVYGAYAAWAPTLPDEVTSALHLMTFPPVPFIPEFLHGRSMAIVIACACGQLENAEKWLKPMRSMKGAEFDSFRNMPYTESGSIFQDPVDPLPISGHGVLLDDFTVEASGFFLEGIGPIPRSPNLMIQLRQLGGAIARRQDPRACILRNRRAKYLAYCVGIPMPDNPPEIISAHAEGVFKAIEPWVLSRGPLNFLGEGTVPASTIRSVFSDEEYERILKVKNAVDPLNRFSNAGPGIR